MKKKSVALYGFAPITRQYVKNTQADEIWTLNAAWPLWEPGLEYLKAKYPKKYQKRIADFKKRKLDKEPWPVDLPRIDRLFDIHHKEYLADPKYPDPYQWPWLCSGMMDFPIYMVKEYPEVPNSVRYPIEAATELVFKHLFRGPEQEDYWAATIMYMIALALLEGFERIEIYGFEMGSSTEYLYQQNGAYMAMGFAMGRGVDIVVHPESWLFRSLRYGYDGGQMITRQALERYKGDFERLAEEAVGRLNVKQGKLEAENANGRSPAELAPYLIEVNQARDKAVQYLAAEEVIKKLIAECDLQEPSPELEDGLLEITSED